MNELTQDDIRRQVEARHPDLRPFLDRALTALYAALWVGDLFPRLAGFDSAAGKWLAENKLNGAYDVQLLDKAISLFLFAYDDAYFESLISGAGYEVENLDRVPICETCGGFIAATCLCETRGSLPVLPDEPGAAASQGKNVRN